MGHQKCCDAALCRSAGGLPIRAFGTFQMKVSDYVRLIDTIAGVKDTYSVDDVKTRVLSILDQLLMKWIGREGKDMFHLQASAYDIGKGMQEDLDMELLKMGMTVTGVQISSFSYPQEIQEKINAAAGYQMVGDMNRYQQGKLADGLDQPGGAAGSTAGMGFGMAAGMQMAQQMMQSMQQPTQQPAQQPAGGKHCPSCGAAVQAGDKFCSGCGQKLEVAAFCPSCGAKVNAGDRFCSGCGQKLS